MSRLRVCSQMPALERFRFCSASSTWASSSIIIKRAYGDQKKIEMLAHIERIGFTILPASDKIVFQAAEYKAEYSISFADCFALASAVEHRASIVTGDPEFRKVEHLAKVVWVK